MKQSKTIKAAVLLICTVFTQFACSPEKPYETAENADLDRAFRTEVGRKTDGAEIYKMHCAECHGQSGEGTDKGISFLKGHALHHPEEDFIRQVTNGEKDEMPAFKDKLTAEEIKAVVKYVREEVQKTVVKKEDKTHEHREE